MCRYVTKLLTWLSWHFLACTVILDAFYQWYIFSVVKFENLFKLYIFVPITRWFSEIKWIKQPSNPRPKRSRPAVIVFTLPQVSPEEKTKSRVSCAQTTWEFEKPKLWKRAMLEHLSETRWQAATVVPIEKRLWFTVHMNFILLRLSRFIFIRIIVLAEASNALDLTKLKIGLSDLIIKMGLDFEGCLWLLTWRRCIFIHALKQILQMNDDHGSPIPCRCDWCRFWCG